MVCFIARALLFFQQGISILFTPFGMSLKSGNDGLLSFAAARV